MDDADKSRQELIEELDRLRRKVERFNEADLVRQAAEEQLKRLSRDLGDRVKELNCLYSISKLRDRSGITWDEILQGIVEIIPSAWQDPSLTCARIRLPDKEFKTDNFHITRWCQVCDITVDGARLGNLEVYFQGSGTLPSEDPFNAEERHLLDAIGERVERIIEHMRAQDQARQQRQQLIQLDKMVALGTLVSGVAHEINNPNNFIMLNAPLLLESWKDIMPILDEYYQENGDFIVGGLQYSEMRENIPLLFTGILEGAKRIKSIVESLKGFARVDTHDLDQSVDMNAVVKSAVTLISNQIRKTTDSFFVEYDADLPCLTGNFQRLEQVIVNLVQNACEALQEKGEGISVVTHYDEGQRSVVVEVRDEGLGIPPEKIEKIVDPFYTTRRQAGGTGLGLSVSSGIVKSHGGTLSFTSTRSRGTTARVTIPIKGGARHDGPTRKWRL